MGVEYFAEQNGGSFGLSRERKSYGLKNKTLPSDKHGEKPVFSLPQTSLGSLQKDFSFKYV
jgi:hypothetical protein